MKAKRASHTLLVVLIAFALVSLVSIVTVSAAGPLENGMGSKWYNSLDADTKATFTMLFGMLIFGFVSALTFFLLKGGLNIAQQSTEMGDPQKMSNSKAGVIGVIVAGIVVVLLYQIFMPFFKWY